MPLLVSVLLGCLTFVGLALLSYFYLAHCNATYQWSRHVLSPLGTRVLLLTAHPDDEVMFFAPTILSLRKYGFDVHILCLSSGNFDGLGAVREKELERSGLWLGISKEKIFIGNFEDNPDELWDAAMVAMSLKRLNDVHKFSAVFTFDAFGVSGHKNHVSLFYGAKEFLKTQKSIQAMRAHHSQLVWFRWLYVLFSRYMFFNSYDEIIVEQTKIASSNEEL